LCGVFVVDLYWDVNVVGFNHGWDHIKNGFSLTCV